MTNQQKLILSDVKDLTEEEIIQVRKYILFLKEDKEILKMLPSLIAVCEEDLERKIAVAEKEIEAGRVYSLEEVMTELEKKYGDDNPTRN